MTKNEKRLLINGIVFPLIIAVIISAVYIYTCSLVQSPQSKAAESADSVYSGETVEAPEFNGEIKDNTIKKSQIAEIQDDTLIGNMTVEDETFPIIYNAGSANAIDKLNIKGDKLIGEVGVCFMEIYKNNSAKIKLLAPGEKLTADTFYSSYEYTVKETYTVSDERELSKAGAGLGRAVVIYTDNSVGAGISSEYYVVVAQMTDGTKIAA